jgi:hypothetical protein
MSGIGHNRPPDDPIERMTELVANANRWIAERPAIIDLEMAGTAQGFLTQLRENRDALEAAMKAERQPLDALVAGIRIKYRDPLELVGMAMKRMQDKLKAWLDGEQARIDREAVERREAERRAVDKVDEARERADTTGSLHDELAARRAQQELEATRRRNDRAPIKAQVRGDLSSRALSMHRRWKAEVIDKDKALKHFGKHDSVRQAALDAATDLASAIAREHKGDAKHCPPGFKFVVIERPQ